MLDQQATCSELKTDLEAGQTTTSQADLGAYGHLQPRNTDVPTNFGT